MSTLGNTSNIEESLIKFLEKQEFIQGETTRYLEISFGKFQSENIFENLVDSGNISTYLDSKNYDNYQTELSKYYFDNYLLEIDSLNKNKKTLKECNLVSLQRVKTETTNYDLLLQTKEFKIVQSPPSQDKFYLIEHKKYKIYNPNTHIHIIYCLDDKSITFNMSYPVNIKQVKLLSGLLGEIKNLS